MRPWKTCSDLLDLFNVPEGEGRARFEDLCDLGALLLRFSAAYRMADLERAYMKERGISPLLFWACQKRALRPLLSAGGDTLRALGVPVEGEPSTVHALASAVAMAMAEDITDEDRSMYTEVILHIGKVLNGCAR